MGSFCRFRLESGRNLSHFWSALEGLSFVGAVFYRSAVWLFVVNVCLY